VGSGFFPGGRIVHFSKNFSRGLNVVKLRFSHSKVQMHGASNRDTHMYPPHNNSSVHLATTTYVRRSGRITDGMRSGWRTLRDSVLSSPTSAPTLPESGMSLPRTTWVSCVRRFRPCLYKWGMASSAACQCGAKEQTVGHVVLHCPINRPPHGLYGLTVLDDETIEWLLNICPEI